MLATTISQTGKKFCLLRIFHLCKFRASFPVLPIWQDPRSLDADLPPVLQILLQPPFPNLTTSPRCPENLHKVSKLRPKSSGHALLRKWHQAAFPSHAFDAHSHHIYLKTFSHSHHLYLKSFSPPPSCSPSNNSFQSVNPPSPPIRVPNLYFGSWGTWLPLSPNQQPHSFANCLQCKLSILCKNINHFAKTSHTLHAFHTLQKYCTFCKTLHILHSAHHTDLHTLCKHIPHLLLTRNTPSADLFTSDL